MDYISKLVERSNNHTLDFCKVSATINSCENIKHIRCTEKLIKAFGNKWDADEDYHNSSDALNMLLNNQKNILISDEKIDTYELFI
jgi:chromosome condensin MukBEF ATPase and DNA-binding subunit MukB